MEWLSGFSAQLHAEWETKQQLSPKIGTAHLADIYAAALESGALGGKVAGAGGGGFMLLYCPFDRRHRIAERLRQEGCTVADLAFSNGGVETWTVSDD